MARSRVITSALCFVLLAVGVARAADLVGTDSPDVIHGTSDVDQL